MKLKNTALLKTQGFINGQWVKADSAKSFTVDNPFDQSILAELPEMGKAETQRAIEAAEKAFPAWRDTSASDRKVIFDRWIVLIKENLSDLKIILTLEQGKPLAQADGEYQFLLDCLDVHAAETLRIHGQVLQPTDTTKDTLVLREPFGVTAGITPWNFPAFIFADKVIQAIAAGNTIVTKPPQDTPLSALALTHLAEQAGMPKGVLNVVVAEDPKAIGDELTSSPVVRRLSFTGSTAVGKHLYRESADTMKSIALECGGNSPLVVFEDADIEQAAAGAAAMKFANCGQICININRVFVHEAVYDAFVKKLVEKAKALVLGSGLSPETTMGPLINQKGLDKVVALVDDAVSNGAKVLTGGKKSDVGALFYEPTVLVDVTPDMRIYHEEIFGPVAAIYTFKTEEEAMKMANDTNYGLAAYFFTKDLGRIFRVSRALEAGSVGVNTTEVFGGGPFGGYKQSGIGREQGRVDTLNEWLEVKAVAIQH